MAITFIQQRKKQKRLIFVLMVVIILIFIVVWRSFLVKPKLVSIPVIPEPPKIEINFGVLKNPVLKELQPFEEINPLEERAGRENPFTPPY